MLIAVLAYLAGSLPLGFFLRRFNVLRLNGKFVSIAADFSLGLLVTALLPKLPQILARFGLPSLVYPLGNEAQMGACALIFAVLGHYFSVYVCGWGGLGLALIMGGFLILTPNAAMLSFAVIALTLLLVRRMKYASIAGALTLPFFVYWQYPLDRIYLGTAVLAAALIAFTHTRFFLERS
ncbi:glycerol-3-phosphate acyltransferase [bacterium]|nr:glycerol-3-phosphate acyltransferase [bacterium]